MTLFEYLAIAYSLIFSFAVVRLVAGLPHALDRQRRSWVHVAYVCLTIFAALALFWSHWSTREVEWTFFTFLVNLSGPGMFYFLACTVIPDEPSAVESWNDYFFAVRTRFFTGLCVYAGIMFLNTTLILGVSLLHPVRLVQLGVLLLGSAGLASDRPSTHGLILLWAAVVAAVTGVVILRPGSLGV